MWRVTTSRYARFGAVLYSLGAAGWIIVAIHNRTVFSWAVAIVWVAVAAVYVVQSIRLRRRSDRQFGQTPPDGRS